MIHQQYVYKAFVTRVIDGDTIVVDIDLGLGVWKKDERIRLAGINAPEIRGESRTQGFITTKILKTYVLEKNIIIKTTKDDKGKYGRYIAEVYVSSSNEWINVGEQLVKADLAVRVTY